MHGFFAVKLANEQRKNGLQITVVNDNSRETLLERIFSLTEFLDVCLMSWYGHVLKKKKKTVTRVLFYKRHTSVKISNI